MKAIILSAGQGKRLLPLTAKIPKCLLTIQGKTILEWQVDTLQLCGVDRITVVTGYGADQVNRLIKHRYPRSGVRSLYNPDYAVSDKLVSCWKARREMAGDFILLNGDTLFEPLILKTLLCSPESPVTVTVNSKARYDSDDMKVILEGRRLVKIGKDIPLDKVNAESIGLIYFRGDGPDVFRRFLNDVVKYPDAARLWYLSVIDRITTVIPVMTCAISGLSWCEVDYPKDLKQAEKVVSAIRLFSNISADQEAVLQEHAPQQARQAS